MIFKFHEHCFSQLPLFWFQRIANWFSVLEGTPFFLWDRCSFGLPSQKVAKSFQNLTSQYLPMGSNHRTSDDEQGVYNHLRNERYLGSMKPFSEGDWIPIGSCFKEVAYGKPNEHEIDKSYEIWHENTWNMAVCSFIRATRKILHVFQVPKIRSCLLLVYHNFQLLVLEGTKSFKWRHACVVAFVF